TGTHTAQGSASAGEDDREACVTAEEDAGPTHRRVVGVERDAGCLGEEALDRNARLEAGKRRTDAEVKTATEREVGSGVGVVNVVMGAPGLLGRWPLGSGPKQEYAAVCGDRHVLEAPGGARRSGVGTGPARGA